jgi:hypothetical protein
VHKIVTREVSEVSLPGIVIAVLSIIIMPLLARAKMNTGRALGLRSLIADAKETIVCSLLSVALLLGLLARWLFDFTLADPIVGLVIVLFLFREGYELVFLGGCSCGEEDECGSDEEHGCCGGGCGCAGDDCGDDDHHDCCGGGCGCSGDDDCGSEKNHDKKEKGCGVCCR